MTLNEIFGDVVDVWEKLASGEITFSYDNLMSAMKPGHPADILEGIISQIGLGVLSNKPVELEQVKECIEKLKSFKDVFDVKELSGAIKKAEQYVQEQEENGSGQ